MVPESAGSSCCSVTKGADRAGGEQGRSSAPQQGTPWLQNPRGLLVGFDGDEVVAAVLLPRRLVVARRLRLLDGGDLRGLGGGGGDGRGRGLCVGLRSAGGAARRGGGEGDGGEGQWQAHVGSRVGHRGGHAPGAIFPDRLSTKDRPGRSG